MAMDPKLANGLPSPLEPTDEIMISPTTPPGVEAESPNAPPEPTLATPEGGDFSPPPPLSDPVSEKSNSPISELGSPFVPSPISIGTVSTQSTTVENVISGVTKDGNLIVVGTSKQDTEESGFCGSEQADLSFAPSETHRSADQPTSAEKDSPQSPDKPEEDSPKSGASDLLEFLPLEPKSAELPEPVSLSNVPSVEQICPDSRAKDIEQAAAENLPTVDLKADRHATSLSPQPEDFVPGNKPEVLAEKVAESFKEMTEPQPEAVPPLPQSPPPLLNEEPEPKSPEIQSKPETIAETKEELSTPVAPSRKHRPEPLEKINAELTQQELETQSSPVESAPAANLAYTAEEGSSPSSDAGTRPFFSESQPPIQISSAAIAGEKTASSPVDLVDPNSPLKEEAPKATVTTAAAADAATESNPPPISPGSGDPKWHRHEEKVATTPTSVETPEPPAAPAAAETAPAAKPSAPTTVVVAPTPRPPEPVKPEEAKEPPKESPKADESPKNPADSIPMIDEGTKVEKIAPQSPPKETAKDSTPSPKTSTDEQRKVKLSQRIRRFCTVL